MRGKKFPTFKRKISYAGNSLVLIIPEDLSKFLNLKKGSEVEFVPLNQRMFAVKVDQK
jgi:antitoxin component of MazEF toxin-antitoxin module